jgi:hypothetical protein
MDKSTAHTLTSEAAAARMREQLTSEKPPPSGGALLLRASRPDAELIKGAGQPPSGRWMFSPEGVDAWCRQQHPERIRKALDVLERAESALRRERRVVTSAETPEYAHRRASARIAVLVEVIGESGKDGRDNVPLDAVHGILTREEEE